VTADRLVDTRGLVRAETEEERDVRPTMSPSDVGTAAVSFTSRVWTLDLITRVPGTTRLIPGARARSDTAPKKSFTPT
jgi:hypothetical protein